MNDPATGATTTVYANTGSQLDYVEDSLGNRTSYDYYGSQSPNAGLVQTVTNTENETTIYEYDAAGRTTHQSGTAVYELAWEYDSFGQMVELHTFRNGSQGGSDVTTWHYDAATGLLVEKEYADSSGVTYDYTPAGQLETRTWARGGVTTYAHNAAGQLYGISYSDGTPSVTYGFDRVGNLTNVTDAVGTHLMTYAADGFLTSWQKTAGILDGYGIVYDRDTLERPAGYRVQEDAQTISEVDYGYDTAGRFGSVASEGHTATYRYDATRGLRLGIDYAAPGQGTGVSTHFAFDAAGRTQTVQAKWQGQTIQSRSYTMDDVGRRTWVDMLDGSYWEYGYNDRGEVISGVKKFSVGTAVPGMSFAYAYDGIGNRQTATHGSSELSSSYTTNALNQYTQVTNPQEQFVLGEAHTSAAITVNGLNASRNGKTYSLKATLGNASEPSVTEIEIEAVRSGFVAQKEGVLRSGPATASPTYDADGNLTHDGLWSYTWNAENRLTAIESASGVPNHYRIRKEYLLDHLGRRIEEKQKLYSSLTSTYVIAETTNWTYDEWNAIAEHRDSQPSRFCTWGADMSNAWQGASGVGGLVMVFDVENDEASYVSYDANGNVCDLIEPHNGNFEARYEYNPFGKTLTANGNRSSSNPWQHSTKMADAISDLIYYGFRDYSAAIGRWIGRDPIGEDGGENLYSFVSNRPIDTVDVAGLFDSAKRDQNEGTATIQSKKGDTISGLEAVTGLDPLEYKEWLQNEDGSVPTIGIHTPIQDECIFRIPNTLLTVAEESPNFWALTNIYLLDVKKFHRRLERDHGYRVISHYVASSARAHYLGEVKRLSDARELYGLHIDGHGTWGLWHIAGGSIHWHDMARQLNYKLGWGYFATCESGWTAADDPVQYRPFSNWKQSRFCRRADWSKYATPGSPLPPPSVGFIGARDLLAPKPIFYHAKRRTYWPVWDDVWGKF